MARKILHKIAQKYEIQYCKQLCAVMIGMSLASAVAMPSAVKCNYVQFKTHASAIVCIYVMASVLH